MPQVGTKRMRGRAKPEDEDDDFDEEEDFESQPSKKRKMADGKGKEEKKAKKRAVKRPTEFKKGKWNPHIELVTDEPYKTGHRDQPYYDCCMRCNNKNVIRAALTGNQKLLEHCISAKNKISNLIAYWSPEIKYTSLEYMVANNQHKFIELLLHPKVHVPQHSTYDQERNAEYQKRAHNPTYLMDYIDTGSNGAMAYGVRTRKVQMTRGNK